MTAETIVRAKKLGGSIVLTVPKNIVDLEDIHPDEFVKINVTKLTKSWFGSQPNIPPFTTEDETQTHD